MNKEPDNELYELSLVYMKLFNGILVITILGALFIWLAIQ